MTDAAVAPCRADLPELRGPHDAGLLRFKMLPAPFRGSGIPAPVTAYSNATGNKIDVQLTRN